LFWRYDMSNKERTIFDSYRDFYRPYVNAMNNRLVKYQLYTSQWGILRLIMLRETCTLAELAKESRVEKPSVTRIIQKLIELGYVEVNQGNDKREKYVRLTQKGIDVTTSIKQEISIYINELTEGIDERELETTRKVLDQVLQKILEKES